jgi:hypothetical protein
VTTSVLKIDERIDAAGHHVTVSLQLRNEEVWFCEDGHDDVKIPVNAVIAVFSRYARVYDSDGPRSDVLCLPSGDQLWQFRHHAAVDATGRDYLALQPADKVLPPIAAISTSITGALRFLLQRR